ncbi:MAG: molybdopterin molybdenumtransferase MoeA [Alphaproteobacteria bacterium]|nr:molybdopterin molybdenumtransferase MoeA [Alphaproteobacteria bacterium]
MVQLSDDCFAGPGAMMTLDQALALVARIARPVVDPEPVPLAAATGRVLAADVVATGDVPGADNSAVDGYAVYFDDLPPGADAILPVTGRAAAGHPWGQAARRGEAIRVFTGALMPAGPDTVLMQEDCRRDGDRVVIPPGIRRGANRRLAGEDVRRGQTVLRAGIRLRPQDVGLAAASGHASLAVQRPLRVAIFSTGDEVRDPGQALTPGTVYDSNRYVLGGLLGELGCRVTDLGILPDDAATVGDALARAAADHDLLFTSGGVSVGEEDHVRTAVAALGTLHAWRVAIKPGRPIALGQIGRVPFVGLPGNPAAAMVTFVTVARELVLRLAGRGETRPLTFPVRAAFARKKKRDRREFVRVRLATAADGVPEATPFPREGAGILSSLVEADGLVALPEDLTRLEAGMMVSFLPFSEVAR